MNKQIVRRFQEFAQAFGIELDLENTSFKLFKISEVADFKNNERIPIAKGKRVAGEYPYYGASGIVDYVNDFIFSEELLLVSEDGDNLKTRKAPIAFIANGKYWVNNHAHILKPKEFINIKYLSYVINDHDLDGFARTDMIPKLNKEKLSDMPVIFPVNEFGNISLQIQEILVRFIEHGQSAHQRRLDGCAVIRPILDKMERSVVPRTLEKSRGARKLIKEFLQEKGIELDYEKVEFEEKKVSDVAEFPSVTRVLGGVDLKLDDYFKLEPTEREKYVPLVSGTVENNQISGFIRRDRISENNLSPKPCLSWTRINGSIFFRQEKSVCINDDSFVLIQKEGISELDYLKYLIPVEASKNGFGWGNKAGVSKIKDLEILVPKDLNELSSIEIQGILTQFFDQYLERVNHNRRVADKLERQIAEYRETYLKLFFKSLKQKAHAD